MAAESAGAVFVTIDGDASPLGAKYVQAETLSRAAGQRIGAALASGAASATGLVDQFGRAIEATTATAAEASVALTRTATAVRGVGTAAERTVPQMAAASGAVRVAFGEQSIRAVERFITLIPGVGVALQAAFPLIGLIALIEGIDRAVDRFGKGSDSAKDFAASMKASDEEAKRLGDDLQRINLEIFGQQFGTVAEKAKAAADQIEVAVSRDRQEVQRWQIALQNLTAPRPGQIGMLLERRNPISSEDVQQAQEFLSTALLKQQADEAQAAKLHNDLTTAMGNQSQTQYKKIDDAAEASAKTAERLAEDQGKAVAVFTEALVEQTDKAQAKREEDQIWIQRWAETYHESMIRVADDSQALSDRLEEDYKKRNEIKEPSKEEMLATAGKALNGTPAGIAMQMTVDRQTTEGSLQSQIGLHAEMLEDAQKINQPLSIQLGLRKQLIEAVIAENAANGRGDQADKLLLANVQLQQTLAQWRQIGIGNAAQDIEGALTKVPEALGTAISSGVFGGGKKGEDVGTQIGKALAGIGKQLLGTVLTQGIEKLVSAVAVQTGLQAALNALFPTVQTAQTTALIAAMGVNTTAIVAAIGVAAGIDVFAEGTDFAPGGMALVGEKGPEIVNLPRGSQVIPNHKTKGYANGIYSNSTVGALTTQQQSQHFHGDMHFHGVQDVDGMMSAISDRAKTLSFSHAPYAS